MTDKNFHIIQKQFVEVSFNDTDDAMGLQNRLGQVFHEHIKPRMHVLFDELFGENHYASINKLEIDCGSIHKNNWEQEFTEQVIRKLKAELLQVNKKEIAGEKVKEINANEAFLFFLANGYLPWNNRVNTITELEELLSVDERLVEQLKELILKKPGAADRIVLQFSKEFTSGMIASFTAQRKNELDEIFLLSEKLKSYKIDNNIIEAAILKVFSTNEKEKIAEQFSAHLFKNEQGNLTELNKNKTINKPTHDEVKEIYINNAGLVLLHPFLQKLFDYLNLTQEDKWLDVSSQHKAVLVLELLTTGNNQFEEFNLMLNKILCGIDIDEIIVTEIMLNDEIKNECEVLLNNVITHWKVLKNTSVAGLRETFLHRDGKLSKIDNGWVLQVEQKTVDVLLNHLPWGIGLIKLPWMNEMLYVEWV